MALIPAEVIRKKRDGHALSGEELHLFFGGYLAGDIPEYQMSALLMAIYFQGMIHEETVALTQYMLNSGKKLKHDFPFLRADKHSTGGVGDKTSLIIGPIVAAAGLGVPMVAGRGLGHTGGTLDKLESIPGFNTRLSLGVAERQISEHLLCFLGQTEEICPADRRLYSLRDVTGTVESLPLICASILSKKLAESLDALVLDIKFGSGAFMKSPEKARALAELLIGVAQESGLSAAALLTSMNQPLGRFGGNALEVQECIEILQERDASKLDALTQETRILSIEFAAWMLYLAKKESSLDSARAHCEAILNSGKAYEKFEEVCRKQGGNLKGLPVSQNKYVLSSVSSGWIESMDTEQIGYALVELRAGRKTITDPIDPTSGIEFHKKIGHKVEIGEPLFTLFGNSPELFQEAEKRLKLSLKISSSPCPPDQLILGSVTQKGFR